VIALLLACATPKDTAAAAPSLVPDGGAWTFAWSDTYAGDCALDAPDPGMPATEAWGLATTPTGFLFYDETGYPMGCTLEDATFTCSKGTTLSTWSDSGLDAVESFTTSYRGTFEDPATLSGQRDILAECEGVDCATVGLQYGEAFGYPCTASLPFTGGWEHADTGEG
jgi:hypothetical protein